MDAVIVVRLERGERVLSRLLGAAEAAGFRVRSLATDPEPGDATLAVRLEVAGERPAAALVRRLAALPLVCAAEVVL